MEIYDCLIYSKVKRRFPKGGLQHYVYQSLLLSYWDALPFIMDFISQPVEAVAAYSSADFLTIFLSQKQASSDQW